MFEFVLDGLEHLQNVVLYSQVALDGVHFSFFISQAFSKLLRKK
jgi:hypothetical protein